MDNLGPVAKTSLILAVCLACGYTFIGQALPWPVQGVVKAFPAMVLAILALSHPNAPIRNFLFLALLFSSMGDWLLSAPFTNGFLFGMAAFFLAQLSYIWTFTRARKSRQEMDAQRMGALALILVFALCAAFLILPHVGSLALPVSGYFLALTLMVLSAFTGKVHRLVRLGALLFLLSDTLIGVDRFLGAIEHRNLLVMGSYYLAQIMIFSGMMRAGSKEHQP